MLYAARAHRLGPSRRWLHRSTSELTCDEAWEELERRGANLAVVPFTGSRRAGAGFGPVRLEYLTNRELTNIETWSEQRSGDPLIEALKAPVIGRFASFFGQPTICGTLSWVLAERCVTITGKRGQESFEETLR